MRKFRFRATYAAVACAGIVLGTTAAAHPSAGPGAPAGHSAGSLADGATWIADVSAARTRPPSPTRSERH